MPAAVSACSMNFRGILSHPSGFTLQAMIPGSTLQAQVMLFLYLPSCQCLILLRLSSEAWRVVQVVALSFKHNQQTVSNAAPVGCCFAKIPPRQELHIRLVKENIFVAIQQPDLGHLILYLHNITPSILFLTCKRPGPYRTIRLCSPWRLC